MMFICGYCVKGGRKRKPTHGRYSTWEDLIDHLVNFHRYRIERVKLVRR
jgi:hypothetical protein